MTLVDTRSARPVPFRDEASLRLSGIEAVTDIAARDWDDLVAQFADAAHEQTHALRGAVWGERRVRRVAIVKNGVTIGLALAVTVLAGPLERGIAYVKFGPLWRRKDTPADARNLAAVMQGLIDEFVVRQRLCLKILPAADPRYAGLYRDVMIGLGLSAKEPPDPNRYLVRLDIDEARQRASLGQKWRYNLKKAMACNLGIAIEEGPDALATFDAMFREMERRKSYKNDSWSLAYERLKAGFPETVRPTVVIVREHGVPIAGAVIGHIGDTAHYLYGATSDRATEIKAGYAMQWWIVGWLGGMGLRWYDLGGEAGEPGLRQFKKGLIGREGAIAPLIGEFSLCRDPLSRCVSQGLDMVRAARASVKLSALKPVAAKLSLWIGGLRGGPARPVTSDERA